MIRDLAESAQSVRQLTADVLVIGAGIAGLLLATRLARAGRRVIVAESGGLSQIGETHPLNQVEQIGYPYSGAEHGRFRCMGGTSTRWGGAMLPFQESDLMPFDHPARARWPIALAELTAYQSYVEELFHLGGGPYDVPEIMSAGRAAPSTFVGRLAKWPPFRDRNVAAVLREQIDSMAGPETWLNATATHFCLDSSGRVSKVALRSSNGGAMEVAAPETVVTAGAIESTRLLLLLDRQHNDRVFAPDDLLGRYFYDHLSLPAARLVDFVRKPVNRLLGWQFEGPTMRSLRFEPSATLRAASGITPGFVHFKIFNEEAGGFVALRNIYRSLQKRERPSAKDMGELALAAPWLARAAWWRYVERRLLFPDHGDLEMHVVVEQEPCAESKITLSGGQVDMFGSPLATIDWRITDNDEAAVRAITTGFASAWASGDLAHLGRVEQNLPEDLRGALAMGGGIYHPGGTIRMAATARGGVVDRDLRTFRIPNLTVVSTATFPTGGGANPTMMLMMAALRTADRIAMQR